VLLWSRHALVPETKHLATLSSNGLRAGRLHRSPASCWSSLGVGTPSCRERTSRSINIWLWERKGVPDQLESRLRSFRDNHFDHIEAEQDIGIIQQAQPRQTAARDSFPLIAINRLERPAEVFPGPRFHLDENERVAIAADDINLAAGAAAEITIQDFVAVLPQELAGQVLPALPKSQMRRRRTRRAAAPPVRKIGDESDKARAHAV
jgi:hypothetical protein